MELSLPRVDSVGTYRMSGTIPPNLDLGLSTGEGRSDIISLDTVLHFSFSGSQRTKSS